MTDRPGDDGRQVARTISRGEEGYPAALERLHDPPARLRVRGPAPLDGAAVAIVGSRAASDYGRRVARALARDLSRLGYIVVSGLARGIDTAAHEGAREGGGVTIAVVPGGLGAITPLHHLALADAIASDGALVSEHDDGMPATRGMFVRRNRLIAALGAATVVVEAARRSGALSTARRARAIGHPVFAVPGDVDRETSQGCHGLLKDGARVCEGAGDVLRLLGPPSTSGADASASVLRALARGPLDAEALARATGTSIPAALAMLTRLAWSGAVRRDVAGRWQLAGLAAS